MNPWSWWRLRVVEVSAAIAMAAAVIVVSQVVADRQREAVPATAWLRINEVYVPDHRRGENPTIIYDRSVLEEFDGFWIVEVQRQTGTGLWTTDCSGSGVNNYDPGEVIENNTVSWEWFIGKPCAVAPGRYRLRTTYTLARPGWPAKRAFNLSNEFSVRD